PVQAIILAAGKGKRLRDRRGRPKCLREVGGKSLVQHQLHALAWAGIKDVTIVVGYQQEKVRRSVGSAARYVVNHDFAITNSMYSFLLARPHVREDVVVLNSDVFFHPRLLGRLLDAGDDALLYDADSGDDSEHMKIRLERDRLVEMSKEMPAKHVAGENVGILRLSGETTAGVFAAARSLVEAGHPRAWLAMAINQVTANCDIRCVDVAGTPWVEVDFPEDLDRARLDVYPAVADAIDACERELDDDLRLRSVS
ncbi:MAG: phosphocholine cytidylyltransferase family protein, partial [Nocardioidaceae bacterium]